MLILDGESSYLQEFTEENMRDPLYFSWLRDLKVVTTIYRLEYLMPLQIEEVFDYVHRILKSKNDCFFAIHAKENEDFIGTLKIGHIDWRVGIGDIGILIGNRSYWGKGIATDAIATACSYAFDVLSLRRLTAGTVSVNQAMCKCFERLGFKKEGVLRQQLLLSGAFVDHILYGLLREERPTGAPSRGKHS